jgi:hypothetical protein
MDLQVFSGYSDLFRAWLLRARAQWNGARTRARKGLGRRIYASALERQLHSTEQFPSSDYEHEHEHEFN